MKSRCGTVAGYAAHYRRDETICEPCRLAKNARSRMDPRESGHSDLIEGRFWPRCLKWSTALGQCTAVENHDGYCVWSVAS